MEDCYNRVDLCGQVLTAPEPSHTNHGETFYRFILSVPRLSGQSDELPVLVRQGLLTEELREGDTVTLAGQLRSFNSRAASGRRLSKERPPRSKKFILSVFARSLAITPDAAPLNRIRLCGAVCKPPVLRSTPLGREICDILLAVNRRCGRSDYLPVIAWGLLARQAAELDTGDCFCAEGRVQSRVYLKVTEGTTQQRTAYEVSVMHMTEREDFPPE